MAQRQEDPQLEITLLQERNAGTFARVYMARVRAANGITRIVAVKVLREKWTETEEILARTRDEAQLLARLQHPNILRVEAITKVNGQPAIVMEYVNGTDLGELMKALQARNERFSARAVYEIMERMLSALSAAYFKVPVGMKEPLCVVHRDIKPSNVMVTAEGSLKVLDFGTARFEDVERIAQTEAIRFGSLKYMSPERREGDRGEHASDIYSAGLMFLELMRCETLATPPMDENKQAEYFQAAIDSVEDFGLPNSAWDDSLILTLKRMLAIDPQGRLDAKQCIPLFRQFKDQAIGDSLAAFAEQVVAPLSNTLSVEPISGELTAPEFETAELETVETNNPATGLPPTVSTSAVNRPDPTPALQVAIPQPFDLASPGYAIRDLETEEMPFDDQTEPANVPAPIAPPTRPAPVSANQSSFLMPAAIYGTVGCVVVSVIIGAIAAVFYFSMKNTADTPIVPTTSAVPIDAVIDELIEAATDDGSDSASLVQVELQAGDPTVQWIRLFNENGDRLLTARPDASGDLPTGTYEIKVKVVARTAISSTLSIEKDTFLRCKPARMGTVRCNDSDDNKRLVIRP